MHEVSKGYLRLTIGGQERNLWFDPYFLELLFDQIPLDQFDQAIEEKPYRLLPVVTYCALRAGDDQDALPENFSVREAGKWAMAIEPDHAATIISTMQRSMAHILSALNAGRPAAPASGSLPEAPRAPRAKAKIRATL